MENTIAEESKLNLQEPCLIEDYFEIDIPYNVFQTIREGNRDLHSMCRICLSVNPEVLYPILQIADDSILNHMFTAITSIQPYQGDGLPPNICEKCQEQVTHCYEFKVKCERADYLLKSVLTGKFVTEEGAHRVVKEDNTNENEVKNEDEVVEDVQYLEEISHKDNHIYNKEQIQRKKRRKSAKHVKGLKGKKFTCDLCSKVFQKEATYRSHVKNHHKKKTEALPYPCKRCKLSFHSEHDLAIHSAIHAHAKRKGQEDIAWKCNNCPKEFKSKQLLGRHLERHMHTKRFSCTECGKTFTEQFALRRHSRVHSGEIVEKNYECHLCDKRFRESHQLRYHVKRHSGERACACVTCGKTFPTQRLLRSHHLVHSDDKPYECLHCHKRFRHESTRITHLRTHTGERPYVCSVCGKRFIQNSNLTLHMRVHTGERPYSCSTCNRNFSSTSSLKAHERVHTGERPYSCELCGKRFARGSLAVHKRTHTGERPYKCSVCSKSFISRGRLTEHCRVHTGEKPYECATCSETFITKTCLIKHVKKHFVKKNPRAVPKPKNKSPTIAVSTNLNKQDYQCFYVKSLTLPDIEKTANIAKTAELKVPIEERIKQTKLIILDNERNDFVDTGNVIIENGNMNFMMNEEEGELNVSSSVEVPAVKHYQVDQSLLQISSVGGQVTISKITSKMTSKF